MVVIEDDDDDDDELSGDGRDTHKQTNNKYNNNTDFIKTTEREKKTIHTYIHTYT